VPSRSPVRQERQSPQRQRNGTHSSSLNLSVQESYSSVLPRAAELERYEALVPGISERIVQQFEAQGDHRRQLERTDLNGELLLAKMGVICALVIALGALFVGGYLVSHSQSVTGVVFGGGGVASIVAAFIYGTNKRSQNLITKAKILRGERLD
jgi:uncharacterized membrane protein